MGTTLDITKIQKGPCKVFFGIAVPAEGAKLIVGAGGVPDATQNPNAKLVGLTDDGAVASFGKTVTEENFDELKEPQLRTIDTTSLSIKVNAAQVLDADNLAQATNGVGTSATISSVPVIKLGTGTLTYTGIAVIAPTLDDPAKYIVIHIYKGFNVAPFDLELARTKRAKIAFEFQGVGIATRAATDTLGMIIPSVAAA